VCWVLGFRIQDLGSVLRVWCFWCGGVEFEFLASEFGSRGQGSLFRILV